ncbi:methyl-accepting chemotaxis protein [Pseudodesulfovibrio senegalensis]|uniref:methyl-accepting chemotaxis protein n=1 Tax=Pseudodesulfovibrio senegalensis TaxID=1721087 RepID=UPI0013761A1A|nr:methyl-accepting chemotaxis protein [Pseudodesulfovibrio senegalensis]
MRLSVKMIFFCLIIGVLPLAGMVGYSIVSGSESLRSEVFDKLASVTQAKKHNLEDITRSWEQDVAVYAKARGVYSALVRLRDIAFYNAQPGKPMDVSNEEFAHALKRVQRDFSVFVDDMGYHDALLMDDTGRIVFTAKKGRELGADLARGTMAGTPLATAWKTALSGRTVFVDFHAYGPLDGEPSAFILAPVRRITGEIEGVAGLRISLDSVNRLMKARAGMGDSGGVFLVGPDRLMRSDLSADMERHSVAASFRSPATGAMKIKPVDRALKGESGTMTTEAFDGTEVLAAYAPVSIGDVRWALVAQMDTDEAFAGVTRLEHAGLVLTAGSCVCIIFITLGFLRIALFKPLNSLRAFAGAVSDGDLEAEATGRFKAELAEVRDAIVIMVGNLRDKMHEAEQAGDTARKRAEEAEAALEDARQARQARFDADQAQRKGMLQAAGMLRHIVTRMNDASTQVNRESENIRENALSQQMRVEQTVDAIEAMSHNIAEVARSAEEAASTVEAASDRARSGAAVVHGTVETMGEVSQITVQLKEEAGDLGEKAKGIGRVMNVISDIADQTNLLALNAAIEAARAGEAGRGFAVVADEVRKLAEKTMDATREVGQSIKAIQEGVHTNMEGMDRASGAVERANGMAGESGAVLNEIMDHFRVTSEQVQGIARASEQQSLAGEEISLAVGEVDKVTLGTAEAVNETGQAISRITRQIDALTRLYGLFRMLGEGRVQDEVEKLATQPAVRDMAPGPLKAVLDSLVREKEYLDMVWVTDANGRMITDFAQAPGAVCTLGADLCDKDWTDRDWHTEPLRTGETYVSNIYYSEVVNDYCLTISAPVMNGDGVPKGVFAADIRPTAQELTS